jgi:hypothetical protein
MAGEERAVPSRSRKAKRIAGENIGDTFEGVGDMTGNWKRRPHADGKAK